MGKINKNKANKPFRRQQTNTTSKKDNNNEKVRFFKMFTFDNISIDPTKFS